MLLGSVIGAPQIELTEDGLTRKIYFILYGRSHKNETENSEIVSPGALCSIFTKGNIFWRIDKTSEKGLIFWGLVNCEKVNIWENYWKIRVI